MFAASYQRPFGKHASSVAIAEKFVQGMSLGMSLRILVCVNGEML